MLRRNYGASFGTERKGIGRSDHNVAAVSVVPFYPRNPNFIRLSHSQGPSKPQQPDGGGDLDKHRNGPSRVHNRVCGRSVCTTYILAADRQLCAVGNPDRPVVSPWDYAFYSGTVGGSV